MKNAAYRLKQFCSLLSVSRIKNNGNSEKKNMSLSYGKIRAKKRNSRGKFASDAYVLRFKFTLNHGTITAILILHQICGS